MGKEKYIANKATRTTKGDRFKQRTNRSSRETETKENNSEKTNQSEIADERTCYACGTKGHKIKDCESKLNIFITFKENLNSEELKRIMEEYGTVKIIKIKEVQTGHKKQTMVFFSKERETQEAITEIEGYEGWNAEVYRSVYNKKSTGKILSRYEDKHEHNTKRKKKKVDLEKELEKMRNNIKEIKKAIMNKNKD